MRKQLHVILDIAFRINMLRNVSTHRRNVLKKAFNIRNYAQAMNRTPSAVDEKSRAKSVLFVHESTLECEDYFLLIGLVRLRYVAEFPNVRLQRRDGCHL